ncbi:MAG: hypothetical protein IJE43_08665 [Alphaproteobacteria bacterium]|nr:hypothetical protein [Alphaproteobacteria bacterium]
MDGKISIEILEGYRDSFNKQEGRKYPCSNQIVVCGVFTEDRNKAIEFMKDKDVVDKRERRDEIIWRLSNGEKWMWRHWNEYFRGYRFYKVAVDRDIDAKLFEYIILPYTSFYCCSFEII